MSEQESAIVHQPEEQRFLLVIDGHKSVADYRLIGNSVDFSHTYVPDALRGRGVAEVLVRTGLSWAKGEGYDVRASCWYARKFIR
ncbi:N-acetyltransferase [Gammaproteobacteria bacterium 54_18_T64]|nr:N-acetyltransferase [Gammaproteobacteria bacterium 54_18_T64]